MLFRSAKGEVGAVPQHEQVTFDSNLSHWVELLHALGHRELLVVAIPIPKSAPGHLLAAALGKLRAAHLSLQVGDYEAVVSQCRMAIESARKVRKAIAADPDAISLYNTGRRTMNKRERELLIEEAINHYSHLAHHAHENGVLEIFGRTDAVLILSATAGVLTATERYVSEHTGDGNS